MLTKKLHDNWKMYSGLCKEGVLATVPGSVYNDLLENGLMEDPYYRDNELKALKIMENDFEYVTVFSAPEEILRKEKVLLHFDGIDTVADIYLNNHTQNAAPAKPLSAFPPPFLSGNRPRRAWWSSCCPLPPDCRFPKAFCCLCYWKRRRKPCPPHTKPEKR